MAKFWNEHKVEVIGTFVVICLFALIVFGFSQILNVAAAQPVEEREYKVLTVYQYSTPITNNYGGIRGHRSMYHVTYEDNNGVICEKEMHNGAASSDTPYEAVYMGEETKLVVKNKGNTYCFYLYLTQEDFDQMQYKLIED